MLRLGLFLAVSSLAPSALAHADIDVTKGLSELDLITELERVPGLRVLEEQAPPSAEHRFFVLSYTQPVDHLDPSRGTFEQVVTLLHRSTRAPTVAFTTGYDLPTFPFMDEPTELIGGNQLGIEERFFASSTPEPADYSALDIFQAASDHHRLIEALRPIYSGKWLSSGASKGGMATVYHRRFFDEDIDGSVVYVAPNDVDNDVDAYDEFLASVGTPACRDALVGVIRSALERRDEIVPVFDVVSTEVGLTFDYVGGPDAAFESAVSSLYWSFWQYWLEEDCATIPPPSAPLGELLTFISITTGLVGSNDASALAYYAYSYQAATQLGYPDTTGWAEAIEDLLLYSYEEVEDSTEAEGGGADGDGATIEFDASAMPDIDRWVKEEGRALLFIYGENDPWSAEPFELGPGTRDSAWYMVAGGNHASAIADLPARERLEATNRVRRWAGLAELDALPEAEVAAEPGAADVATAGAGLARSAQLALRQLPPPRIRY